MSVCHMRVYTRKGRTAARTIPHSILECLTQNLPLGPLTGHDYNNNSPTSAHKATYNELKLELQLRKVVRCATMLDDLVSKVEQLMADVPATPADREHILPHETSMNWPGVILSEVDTTCVIDRTFLRPVERAVNALKSHLLKENPSAETGGAHTFASATGDWARPDSIWWNGVRIELELTADGTLEFKVPAVLDRAQTTAPSFFQTRTQDGTAARFRWPTSEAEAASLNMFDQLIVQIWAQMVKHGVERACLTSYDMTFFCCRVLGSDNADTLWISPPYEVTAEPSTRLLLLYTAFAIARCPFAAPAHLKLPRPNSHHWATIPEATKFGLDHRTIEPNNVNRELARIRRRDLSLAASGR